MRIIITDAQSLRSLFQPANAHGALDSLKPATDFMRVIPISLSVASMALFLIACGQEAEDPPTSAPAPTEIPTATQTVQSTSTAVATEVIATPTTEAEPSTNAEEKPEPTIPPTATEPPPTEPPAVELAPERDLEIVTLLPPDAIPAIDNPIFFETTEEADAVYSESEYVLGVEIDGDARAYSVPLLSSHEIVNDTVGGRPIAVTW